MWGTEPLMHVVATAGHVDHGKSTLVKWLTGIDPDRLAEEKARGMTVDLGFAWTSLPSGRAVAFVDVPGHVRFLRNMLAGVGAVDACLFVVAATEGWKPQSEEHLRILEVLGITDGVVAVTKAAQAAPDLVGFVRADVRARLDGTPLAGAEMVAVDAPAGLGRGALVGALERFLARAPSAEDSGRPRLWIDRFFAASGSGTVVTGTLTGGSVAVGQQLAAVPGPGPEHDPLPVRVRALQSHHRMFEVAGPGRRVAVNIRGAPPSALGRGQALVRPRQWAPSRLVDASLRVLDAAPCEVSRRGAFFAYLGSGEWPVRLRVLSAPTIVPGAHGCVRLHLPVALPLLPGDRYVLRDAGRSATVGGGELLDVAPVLPAARARPDRSVERVVAERGWVEATHLEQLTGERRHPIVGSYVVDPDALTEAAHRLEQAIAGAGDLGLPVATLEPRDRLVLDSLVTSGRAARVRDRVVPAGTDMDAVLGRHPFLELLDRSAFRPPDPLDAGVSRAELRQLVAAGLVAEHDGVFFSARALDEATDVVQGLLARQHQGIRASDLRVALDTTRKYVLPLLGLLDARGVTRRQGDLRVAGPALGGDVPAA